MDLKNEYGVQTTDQFEAGGLKFETVLLPAGAAVDLLPTIVALGSGPAGIVIDLLRSAMQEGSLDAADLGGTAVREHMRTLAEEMIKAGGSRKIKELLINTTVQLTGGAARRVDADFDNIFAGRMSALAEIVIWVVGFNFRPLASGGSRPTSLLSLVHWLKKSQLWQEIMPLASTSTGENGSGGASRAPGKSRRAK